MANRLDQLLRVTATGHSQCSSPVVLFQVTMSSTWVSSSVPGVAPIKSGANEAGSSVVGCSGGTILIEPIRHDYLPLPSLNVNVQRMKTVSPGITLSDVRCTTPPARASAH